MARVRRVNAGRTAFSGTREPMSASGTPSVTPEEVARFAALGEKWWDPEGPMAPLHKLTPLRVAWARDRIARRFQRDPQGPLPLAGLDILDVGCGAGLFAEPLARLGANVLGMDPAVESSRLRVNTQRRQARA